jgi:hypothetical protein
VYLVYQGFELYRALIALFMGKSTTLVLDVGDISKTRCSLPAPSSTTARTKLINAFSHVQKGWTYKQVRSHTDITLATPEPVQLFGLAAYTIAYNVYLADNLSLDAGIEFGRNKKVDLVSLSLAKNVGKENQKACFWQLQMR